MFELFITIAGFIIGLGAVTVIDIHGFLGRTSSYWTEATIRTHKVTKPLIWVGMWCVVLGTFLLYRGESFGFESYRVMLALEALMILNGYFLSFVVSPYLLQKEREGKAREILDIHLQRKIFFSFMVSFCSWWGLLLYILMQIVVS